MDPSITAWRVRVGDRSVQYESNSELFSIKYHHGGHFVWGNPISYVNGECGVVDHCIPGEMSYLELVGMANNLGYLAVDKLYFKQTGASFESGLVEIRYDSDAQKLGENVDDARFVEVYCEAVDDDLELGIDDANKITIDSDNDDEDYVVGTDSDVSFGTDDDIGRKDDDISDDNVEGNEENFTYNYDDTEELDEGYLSQSDLGSDDDSNVIHPKFAKSDMAKVVFALGMEFPTADDFRLAVKEYNWQNGKNLKFKKNSKSKMNVVCVHPCKYRIYCSSVRDQLTVQIKTFIDKHTCTRAQLIKNVTPLFIARKYLDRIRINPNWKALPFRDQVAAELQCNVTMACAYRALDHARKMIDGKAGDQYDLLWDYAAELRRTNPDTTVKIEVENGVGLNGESQFLGMYICWGSLKRGFLEGCRPLIGLDGCHLSGPHKGIMLTAVGIDPNNCMYPFAYAIVPKENDKNWYWFLDLLVKDLKIQRPEDYCIMSDKQKGLIKAVEKILPNVEHRYCVRHLYNNFKLEFRGVALKEILWMAARASTHVHFQNALEEMKAKDENAYKWLITKAPEHWSRSHFRANILSDLLLNNLCESYNACIKEPRGKPILTMFEEIRRYLMEVNMKKKVNMSKRNFKLCPKIQKKLDELKVKSHDWIARFNGSTMFEVTGSVGQMFQVDIDKWKCGCYVWQLTGIPCVHAIACLHYQNLQPENFVHNCYSRSMYMRTYKNVMIPINGRDLWPKTNKGKILPPIVVTQAGRPKKSRNREPDEPSQKQKRTKLSKKGGTPKCSDCGKEGHNKRTCKPGRKPVASKGKGIRKRVPKPTLVDESNSDGSGDETVNLGGDETVNLGGDEQLFEVQVQGVDEDNEVGVEQVNEVAVEQFDDEDWRATFDANVAKQAKEAKAAELAKCKASTKGTSSHGSKPKRTKSVASKRHKSRNRQAADEEAQVNENTTTHAGIVRQPLYHGYFPKNAVEKNGKVFLTPQAFTMNKTVLAEKLRKGNSTQ